MRLISYIIRVTINNYLLRALNKLCNYRIWAKGELPLMGSYSEEKDK